MSDWNKKSALAHISPPSALPSFLASPPPPTVPSNSASAPVSSSPSSAGLSSPPVSVPLTATQPQPASVPVTATQPQPSSVPVTATQPQPSSVVSEMHTDSTSLSTQPQSPPQQKADMADTETVPSGGVVPSGSPGTAPDTDKPPASPTGEGTEEHSGWLPHWARRVLDKTKTSMDGIITTLDPQMKEFIYSGGDIEIVVASDKEVKVGAVREAFQTVFGKATVRGMEVGGQESVAQPVGFPSALRAAEARLKGVRSLGRIEGNIPIIAVENFIVELTDDVWQELGVLVLDDPHNDVRIHTYTQTTPIPTLWVTEAQNGTPDDYSYREQGLAVTIGQVASQHLQVARTEWQAALTGVPRREAVLLAARTLAGLYQSRLSKQSRAE